MAGVFSIPAGAPFARLIAAHARSEFGGDDPAALARLLILVPTRRAALELRGAFMVQGSGGPLLLPSIRSIADGAEEEIDSLISDPGLMAELAMAPPVIDPLHRQFLLSEMIQEHAVTADMDIDVMQAFDLAGTLARLLDDFLTENIDPAKIDTVLNETALDLAFEYAVHWQASLDVLRIVMRDWPARLDRMGQVESALRRAEILGRFAEQLRTANIDRPIIAAGSTGTISAAADLLGAIAELPNGSVVLPGLDLAFAADGEGWEAIGPDHPQATLKALLARLEINPPDVGLWPGAEPFAQSIADRRMLLTEALRPADTTDQWKDLAATEPASRIEAGLDGLCLIEAKTQAAEAQMIALILRHALEQAGKTAALVTPDRNLARRVAAALTRWDIQVDDSAGVPLTKADTGRFLSLVADAVLSDFDPTALVALMNHPFAAGGRARLDFLADARLLDRFALRGTRQPGGLDGIHARLIQDEERQRGVMEDGGDKAQAAARSAQRSQHLQGFVLKIADLLSGWSANAPATADQHAAQLALLAEAMAQTDQQSGPEVLWSGNDGMIARDLFDRIIGAGGHQMTGAEFGLLLRRMMDQVAVRAQWGGHPRLNILGPAEARMIDVDVVVLGGLNEGVWPQIPETGAWLNRDMRTVAGLTAPERQIGRSAHDFVQSAAMPRVYLTRADNVDGTPQVASRWILRLKSLVTGVLGGDRATELLADKGKYLEMAGALDGATEVKRLSPPKPCPPIAKRPVGLSVTQIETWIRDPYAIYARHILRLEKLDRIGMSPSALDRGILIHQVMEEFVHDHMDTLPPDALENLLERGKAAFAPLAVWPTEHAFWTTRFGRAAEWFLEDETHWRAAGNSPLALEVWGRTQIDGFEIRAKADRIDLGPKGLVLQDYKTGQTPTLNQVASGLSPQLPLEAIIARDGGFENVPAQSVADLVYVRLSGGSDPGARKNVLPEKPKKDGPQSTDEIVELVLAGFRKWIEQYRDPAHPYPSRFAPLSQSFQGDYDHLARVRAWLAGGDGDEE